MMPHMWQDEQFRYFDLTYVLHNPRTFQSWNDFQEAFKARWTDPYEAEKTIDRIMRGLIAQRMSVKVYNDHFNDALLSFQISMLPTPRCPSCIHHRA